MIVAAATMAPGYWPDVHLGNQLQTATLAHPSVGRLPANLGNLGGRLFYWLRHHL
jgi:hypothetical protein